MHNMNIQFLTKQYKIKGLFYQNKASLYKLSLPYNYDHCTYIKVLND